MVVKEFNLLEETAHAKITPNPLKGATAQNKLNCLIELGDHLCGTLRSLRLRGDVPAIT